MYHRRETTWIGFQEAQKTISNLKQEVEIAERKLLTAKRTFYERTNFKSRLQSGELSSTSSITKVKDQKQSHFIKETLPGLTKFASVSNGQNTVPKELFFTSEEEPNFLPSEEPHEPPDFKNTLVQSSIDNLLSELSSSEDASTSNAKRSSSEGTSSLIASTYRDADKLLKKQETRIDSIPSDVLKSSTSVVSDEVMKMPSIEKSSLLKSRDIGMEWKPVSVTNKKSFVLHSKIKPDGIQKLRDIIQQQKKKQEQYQMELEEDLSLSLEQPGFQKLKPTEDHSLESGENTVQVPVRKVCLVKSLPVYKGFSAPPTALPSNMRWKKQRKKFTIAKSSNAKINSMSAPKRIKAVVKCKSDFASITYGKETQKTNPVQDEKLDQAMTDEHSKTSSEEKLKDLSLENKDKNDRKPLEENTYTKIDTESILKEKQPSSGEDSSKDAKNETFSNDGKLNLELLKTLNSDKSSLKENEKPIKSKAVKRKAKKPLDQTLSSPKIRHYDVDIIRDYIKKKKEERRKRHQEEYKKHMHEVQKKKESLEKLYEYHKQNKKSVGKGKPLSPIKIFQKKDVLGREHENQHDSNISKNSNLGRNSGVPKASSIEDKEISVSNHEFDGGDVLIKNQKNLQKIHTVNQENLHIDISIPKFISEHDLSQSMQQIKPKDTEYSAKQSSVGITPGKGSRRTAKKKHHKKHAIVDTVKENAGNEINGQSLFKLCTENEETADTRDSFQVLDMFRTISSVSTPSGISHIIGLNASLVEGLRNIETPVPEVKSKKAEVLKDLVKSINMLTKPLEPLLRTRKWVEDSPHPPRTLKKIIAKEGDISKRQDLQIPEKNLDFQNEISESVNSKNSSFIEQVSGIGDVSQLYAKFLGQKSPENPVQIIQKDPDSANSITLPQVNEAEDEDELIEGTLDSEEFVEAANNKNKDASHHSNLVDDAAVFSDLQKACTVPDPFNFINTWKRKPLGLSVHGSKANETENVSVPSRWSENAPFEEMYKTMLSISHTDIETEPTENNANDLSSYTPFKQSTSREDTFSDLVSKRSSLDVTSQSNHSFVDDSESISSNYKSYHTSHKLLSKHSYFGKSLNEKESHKEDLTVRESNEEKKSESLNSIQQSLVPESTVNHSSKEEIIQEHLQESSSELNLSALSDRLISGTINSQYSLEIEAAESSKDQIEEFSKETAHDRASASGSSISEVISVVENSKGFRSSVEELQLDKVESSKSSAHSSIDEKPKTASSDKEETHSKLSYSKEKIKASNHSSQSSDKDSEHSLILLKNDQLQNIPSGSQNSVTIDFRQPLRLTLSNGESVQSNQGIDLHENQYLHTQVVTRVASEAAAAAATSAVIAVFETQKALLAEKNYLGVLNSFGRSSGSKKTQYSSDFESSPPAKSSSHSPQSSSVESKHSNSIPEYISGESNKEFSSKNGSSEEKFLSEYSIPEEKGELKSSQNSSVKTEEKVASIPLPEMENERKYNSIDQKTPQRSKRKISGNVSSPSPASLSDNESISSETIMSSHSDFSLQSESALSDDSFAQLTLDVVRRMTHEEELRAKHQLSLLQFQEKTLVEKARAEMMWLELLKKKLREKGSDKKVSSIKKRQKELILRLRQERSQLQCMQEAYRSICEKHRSLLEDKKKLLKEPNSLAFQLLSKDEKPHTSKHSENKMKEFPKPKSSSSTPTVASDNDIKTVADEESVSEVPEMLKGLASNSSQESVVETQASEQVKTSSSSQNKSQRSSPNPTFSPLNATQSNSNQSLHSNNSLETALQGLKKLEASKRHLTKREQRILQRRKQVESLLQWQMKLDSEEMAVRELEQKALDLVDHSKKRTKYYISSSGSTHQDEDKRKESVYESLPQSEETSNHPSKLADNSPLQVSSETENKTPQITSDESIPTNFTENNFEGGGTVSEKGSVKVSSGMLSSGSLSELPEEIKFGSGGSSIHTLEATENGSHVDEIVSDEISYQISPSVKDKSSSSDIYSESFESSGSRKNLSVLSPSSPFKSSSPLKSVKKDGGLGIRLPLVPRNLRRHDSSGSDDSYTISQSETASDQSDIEVRIHALTEELKRRKAEAEKLKRKKYREQLKEKELSLQKQLEAYNQYINQAKLELEHQIECAVSPPQAGDLVVKPRIKWPRPEQVIDSRRVRKQAACSSDSFALEKKPEFVTSNPESPIASLTSEKGRLMKKVLPESTYKVEEESNINEVSEKSVVDPKEVSEKSTADSKEVSEKSAADSKEVSEKSAADSKEVSEKSAADSKEVSEKSAADSKEISEAFSVNISSEIQEVSEIEQSKSVSSEVSSDIKEISETNEISAIENNSFKLQKLDEPKSSHSDQKHSSVVLYQDENRSSHDATESKSPTDTFITESISSRSLDSNSPKQSDDSVSNKTVSSDDEQNIKGGRDLSGDISQKSDAQQSQDMSQYSISSEESISEVQSVINSLSAGDDLEEENSSKNSKCNSSEGCEISLKSELPVDVEKTTEELFCLNELEEKQADENTDIQPLNASSVKDKKMKLLASESEIVNIVNYISSFLIDDALQAFYEVSNQKCILGKFLNAESCKGKSSSLKVRENVKEKTAEALSIFLFDTYLRDAVDSFFRIVKGLKNISENTSFSVNNNADSTVILPSIINKSLSKAESSDIFQSNNMIQDINDNEISTKSAFWTTHNLVATEREQQIQQLEQQLVLQQYSYFYRKIPNKPPPPYTPPSSSSTLQSSNEFPFVKEKPIEKTSAIKEITKDIDKVVYHAVETLLTGNQEGLPVSEISFQADESVTDNLGFTTPHQHVFLDLVFDLTKEIVLETYSETHQVPQPWLRPRKLTPKPLIASSKGSMPFIIQKEIKKALKINAEPTSMKQRKQILWSSLKLGRKKRDFVDTILISELKEEEPDWINYDQDEVTVKLQIADSIFNVLIEDTVNVVKDLQLKIAS